MCLMNKTTATDVPFQCTICFTEDVSKNTNKKTTLAPTSFDFESKSTFYIGQHCHIIKFDKLPALLDYQQRNS